MLFLGDFIYVDVPKRFGSTIEDYRREYRQVYSSPDWPAVGQNLSWIHVLDDHEIANDWDANVTGVYNNAADPVSNSQTNRARFIPTREFYSRTLLLKEACGFHNLGNCPRRSSTSLTE